MMDESSTDSRVRTVREFNRFYTRVLGLLEEGLLDSPYCLTEVRILFELGQREATEVGELRRIMEVDAGYLSRILAGFENDGLVTRSRSPHDARRQVARLTDRGRELATMFDRRSAAQIADWLAPLQADGQRRLVASMSTIRDILTGSSPPTTVVLRAPEAGDLGWVVSRHGALYTAEYGWDDTFEGLVAGVAAEYLAHHDPAREAGWIAEIDGERVGSVFCVRGDDETAKLRLLLVEPTARGHGVGARLVGECLRFARRAGYRRISLWTVDVLHAARRIYERAGFTLVDENPQHVFGHDLVGQTWARDL